MFSEDITHKITVTYRNARLHIHTHGHEHTHTPSITFTTPPPHTQIIGKQIDQFQWEYDNGVAFK